MGLLLGLAACMDWFGPPVYSVRLTIVPVFDRTDPVANAARAEALLSATDQLRIRIEREATGGTFTLVRDTTVPMDPATGDASADISVALLTSPQRFRVLLDAIRSSDGAVLFSGVEIISVTDPGPGQQPPEIQITPIYTGPTAARVAIAPPETVLTEGATFRFRATAFDAANNAIDVPLEFEVPDPAHANILSVQRLTGQVTAGTAAPGVAAVLVVRSFDTPPVSDAALVFVCSTAAGPIRTLVVSPAAHTFTLLGETVQLNATGKDVCNNSIPNPAVTWASSAPTLVTVGADGVARARDNGSATVTATLVADASIVGPTALTATIPLGALRGLVRREEDGSPVPGVEMILTDVFGRERRATSGADGIYVFTGVLAGPGYVLEVNTATLPAFRLLASPAQRTLDIAPNVTTDAPETVVRKPNIPVTVAVSAASVAVGGETEVTLKIDMTEVGPALGALTARIQWSDAVLRYVAGSFAPVATWDAVVPNAAVPGELTLSAVSAEGIADNLVTVARFRLQARAAGVSSLALSAAELSAVDAAGTSYNLLQLGTVTFTGAQVTVTP